MPYRIVRQQRVAEVLFVLCGATVSIYRPLPCNPTWSVYLTWLLVVN